MSIEKAGRERTEPGYDEPPLHGVVIASPAGIIGGGGTGSVTLAIKTWLIESGSGIRIKVLDPRGNGSALFWPFYFLRSAISLISLHITQKPEILHLQVTERFSLIRKGLLLKIGQALGMGLVVHHHGAEFIAFYRNAAPRTRDVVATTLRNAHLNIVLGEPWRRFLIDEVGVAPERVTILYNATKRLPMRVRSHGRETEWGEAGAHIVMLANLGPRKGVGEFLMALSKLVADGEVFHVTLAGGGEVQRYQKEAASLGLASHCRFTGWIGRKEVDDLLASADTLVLPSYDEGLPMVILEALSAGVPVVATPVGSIPEVLTHEEHCLFVQPGDIDGLKTAIKRVISDAPLVARLVENGRKLHETRFELGAYMRKLIALYSQALETKKKLS